MELTDKEIHQILSNVDNWGLSVDEVKTKNPHKTSKKKESTVFSKENLLDNKNKIVTKKMVQTIFDSTLLDCLAQTYYQDYESVPENLQKMFLNAVFILTASNLWNKYNVQKNNNQMEGIYTSSYGGILYKRAMNSLNNLKKSSTLVGL